MKFIDEAFALAKVAHKKNEVPVGAVIVKDGKIIAKAYNKKNKTKNPIKHAEIIAIEKACKKLKDWRLEGCDIYVTLLPCPMCAGAIVSARIKNCFYGAASPEEELIKNIFEKNSQNHKVKYENVKDENCLQLLKNFFKTKRK